MEAFWRRGYTATSMAELTAAMGIGAPSLYAAFGSKEQLYAEAIRHYVATRAPRIWSRFAAAPTARAAISALLFDSASILGDGEGDVPRGCMIALAAAGNEGCAPLGRMLEAQRGEGLTAIRDRLRRGIADGELHATTDVEALARYYCAVQGGLSLLARDGASRSDLEAVARTAMAVWPELAGAGSADAAPPARDEAGTGGAETLGPTS